MFQQVTRAQRRRPIVGMIVFDHIERTPLGRMKTCASEMVDQCRRVRGEHRDEPVSVFGSVRSGNSHITEPLN